MKLRSMLIPFWTIILLTTAGCQKFLTVETVNDQLLAQTVFESDGSVNSAIAGIYLTGLRSISVNQSTFLYSSLASGDVYNFQNSNANFEQYRINQIDPTNGNIPWDAYYNAIYQANLAIESIAASSKLSPKAKLFYNGEARFLRAFCYFHLVNLFGDVPLILQSDINQSKNAKRATVGSVYDQIIQDLKAAQNQLDADYAYTGGERTRANKWVATALLARVYLYLKDYANAEQHASLVINSGAYNLLGSTGGLFNKNNSEAILQLALSTTDNNSTVASSFIFTTTPVLLCSSSLVNSFETGDLRKSTGMKTAVYSGQTVYYPYKFTSTAANSGEYPTLIRLGEMYLIRSESLAMQNNFTGSIADINLLRSKHGGLTVPLAAAANQTAALDIVIRQRQVELFVEGMHRWFDLKRTGRIDAVMQVEKPTTWKSHASLYPIPLIELQRNNQLIQNPGY